MCPVVDCEWENWSVWSDCTKSCDGGTETRTRGKVPAQHGGAECEGASEQTRDCNTDECPCTYFYVYMYIYNYIIHAVANLKSKYYIYNVYNSVHAQNTYFTSHIISNMWGMFTPQELLQLVGKYN